MIEIIKNKIKSNINIIKIEIIDQSSNHLNHAGNNGGELSPQVLSTAIRHHLYDEVLYHTGDLNKVKKYVIS